MAGTEHTQGFTTLTMYTQMTDKIFNTIAKYNMINKGDTVAVCLSGGADSMALFHFLCVNKKLLDINVLAIHINHGLRSESADEEQFVVKYCEKMGCICHVKCLDMLNSEKPKGLSTESWARQLRYEFFADIAQKEQAILATAHTLSDRAETVIFNIVRGSGIKGSIGIPAVRDNIIRPLIDCTRSEIEEYCRKNSIPYVTDETNFEDIYSRNKIRLNVVPVLKQINADFEAAISSFTQESEEIYTFLTQLSDNLYRNSMGINGFDVNVIKKSDKVVIKHFLRNVLAQHGCLSKDNIDDIYNGLYQNKFSKQLKKDIFCHIKNSYLYLAKSENFDKDKKNTTSFIIEFDKNMEFFSKTFVFSILTEKELQNDEKNNKNTLIYYADYDKMINTLILRSRIVGDKFTSSARNVTKSLKKLFIEDKIPISLRDKIAVLSDEAGNVIWLEDYGVDKKYSVGSATKNILKIKQL